MNGNTASTPGKATNKNILNQIKIHIHSRMHFEPPFVKSKFEINSLRRGKRQLGNASKSNQAWTNCT